MKVGLGLVGIMTVKVRAHGARLRICLTPCHHPRATLGHLHLVRVRAIGYGSGSRVRVRVRVGFRVRVRVREPLTLTLTLGHLHLVRMVLQNPSAIGLAHLAG